MVFCFMDVDGTHENLPEQTWFNGLGLHGCHKKMKTWRECQINFGIPKHLPIEARINQRPLKRNIVIIRFIKIIVADILLLHR